MPFATSCPMCIIMKYAMFSPALMALKGLVAESKRYLEI